MYNRMVIENKADYNGMLDYLDNATGWLAFDTETTGLHLKADKPFILTITTNTESFAVPEEFITQELIDTFADFDLVLGHNVKYDLHMLANIGITYRHNNLSDTMIMARLSLDTDEVMSLALKGLAKKYLYEDAGADEKAIKSAITALKRQNTAALKNLLKEHGKTKKWFDEKVKDTVFEPSDLGDFEKPYLDFIAEHPEPNYLDVYEEYRVEMLDYAMNDTEITLELAKKFYPTLLAREQEAVFKQECSLILPLFRMERVGLQVDRDYLEESRINTKRYILQKRRELEELVGEPIKVGQHKRIKDIFAERWEIGLQSSDDKALSRVVDGDPAAAARIIQELRTLEKWYSAYILRLQDKSAFDGRAYTQINQASAVTGRVSSDFQQFPKYGVYGGGVELFNPRRAIVITGGAYSSIAYLDYSQIELRVQANYTYVISGGDTNMCRAYMPFKAHNGSGAAFIPGEDNDTIFTEKWFLDENNEVWSPLDLHSATTKLAFPDVTDPAEFKKVRALGKAANFAKNYGATTNALMNQLDMDKDTAERLNQAYYDAFPKVLDYQKLVSNTYKRRGFVKNMYGRRYYMSSSRFVYKLYNYIVQGTSADMLKQKIIEVDKFLLPYKTRFQMNIHDELSFEIYKGEEHLIPALKKIMENVDWMTVPVVADAEITYTNWADKEDYEIS